MGQSDTAQKSAATKIPEHLKPYVVEQHYEKYTAQDHATWRFIMRQTRDYYEKKAHPAYIRGLESTGIPRDRIPRIEDIDRHLAQFGWGAVCICGFIPPLVFLEFQANRLMPIATDMRRIEHILYTPAPDIVHEAAGHTPMLAEKAYRDYLQQYAQIARKAIFSDEDIRLYEAIRILSDIKERVESTKEQIQEAIYNLEQASRAITWTSEASKVARMSWWTIEYGLLGSMQNPLIYGAGLLSSLSESRSCLAAHVKKIQLKVDCVEQGYDITEPQPQLFIAKDWNELCSVLKELEDSMSFHVGGTYALNLAKKAKTITTTILDSGLEISAILEDFFTEAKSENVSFIRWSGPAQLCHQGKQLEGQGRLRHPQGFSCPLGSWKGLVDKQPFEASDADLKRLGLVIGQRARLEFLSGFQLEGRLKNILREPVQQRLLLMTWEDVTVKKDDQVYFDPSWGEFDMPLGQEITSVCGGPGDWSSFGHYEFGNASSSPERTTPYSQEERSLFKLYESIRGLRETLNQSSDPDKLERLLAECSRQIIAEHPYEWLIAIEVLELYNRLNPGKQKEPSWLFSLESEVLSLEKYPIELRAYIREGVELARKVSS
ncbi:MAG: aromatic amino acid hydroxylase [Oligoflexales bacterium]|nr:aromatic amino acid hydroxylase [Oligoflexales bacterium]